MWDLQRAGKSCYPFENHEGSRVRGRRVKRGTSSLAAVVQTLDSAIHRINPYPAGKYYGNQLRYPLDSDLSGGQRYPTFEQPGPGG